MYGSSSNELLINYSGLGSGDKLYKQPERMDDSLQ